MTQLWQHTSITRSFDDTRFSSLFLSFCPCDPPQEPGSLSFLASTHEDLLADGIHGKGKDYYTVTSLPATRWTRQRVRSHNGHRLYESCHQPTMKRELTWSIISLQQIHGAAPSTDGGRVGGRERRNAMNQRRHWDSAKHWTGERERALSRTGWLKEK